MGILSWIILGLVAGVIAKLLMPGTDPGGCLLTIALGIAGGLIGGFIGTRIGWGAVDKFDLRSLMLAVGGSMLLLIIYRLLKRQPVVP
jgi:Predicted membrane protein